MKTTKGNTIKKTRRLERDNFFIGLCCIGILVACVLFLILTGCSGKEIVKKPVLDSPINNEGICYQSLIAPTEITQWKLMNQVSVWIFQVVENYYCNPDKKALIQHACVMTTMNGMAVSYCYLFENEPYLFYFDKETQCWLPRALEEEGKAYWLRDFAEYCGYVPLQKITAISPRVYAVVPHVMETILGGQSTYHNDYWVEWQETEVSSMELEFAWQYGQIYWVCWKSPTFNPEGWSILLKTPRTLVALENSEIMEFLKDWPEFKRLARDYNEFFIAFWYPELKAVTILGFPQGGECTSCISREVAGKICETINGNRLNI